MIVVDTNVLSELMRETPNASVRRWLEAQVPTRLFTTSICEAELLYGVALLPSGRRRTSIQLAAEAIIGEFGGRVLAFDSSAARAFAIVASERRSLGRPIGEADAQIASIARVHGATVATRDVADFADCGVSVVSPWSA